MRESSLIIYDGRVVSMSQGSSFEVPFDFEIVWGIKKNTENFDPGRLIWIHVHPPGITAKASDQDLKCMKALKIAFGKLGRFGIVCFTDSDFNSYDGEIAWWNLDEKNQLVIESIEKIDKGTPALFMLKAVAVASPNTWTEELESD